MTELEKLFCRPVFYELVFMALASKDHSLMYFRKTPVYMVDIRSGDLFSPVSHSVGAEILFAEYESIILTLILIHILWV